MKKRINWKNNKFSFLLVKQYIIFTMTVVLLIAILSTLERYMEDQILRYPQFDTLLLYQDEIENEKFDKLTVKKLLRTEGFLEVLNDEKQVIYSQDPKDKASYLEKKTEQEKEESYLIETYTEESGKKRNRLVFEEFSEVITYRYNYVNKAGEKRTLLLHVRELDSTSYRKLDLLWRAAIPVFIVFYILLTSFFIIWLNKKVKQPLQVLKKGITDLTEGKQESVVNYKGQQEFEQICESFNEMSARLRESEEKKRQLESEKQKMLADISHDLKTPITVIQGYARAMSDGLIEESKREYYLKLLYAKSENLNELINTFYNYSQLEHPDFTYTMEEQDIVEYMREYLAVKYEEIEMCGGTIDVDIPEKSIACRFDKVQLKRVFENIIGNSLKHNEGGLMIYVKVTERKNKVIICIGDNGKGIPKEIRHSIFEAFIVGDESRNNKQGSGLGMAVARKIVEAHAGTIELLEEERAWNTEFRIILPILDKK